MKVPAWLRRKQLVEVTLVVDGGTLWRGVCDPRIPQPITLESTRPVVSRARKFEITVRKANA